jgi:DNA processing protein
MLGWKKWKIKERNKDNFPPTLKKIKNCPQKLFYRGEWQEELFDKTLAIVGSRRMSRYGREVISKLMPDLIASKVVVISGFMYGVDSEAHRQCLELGGQTIAVLGGGLDFLTPTENDWLYSQILSRGGLVISEYEADFKPQLWTFPQRNRIVAALATLGIMIVEAGIRSGSLITARLGREQGKVIWAVPGPINSRTAEGTNYLIKNNLAKLADSGQDIVGLKTVGQQTELFGELGTTNLASKILSHLENEGATIDELMKDLNSSISEISVEISKLLLDGRISEEGGKVYLQRQHSAFFQVNNPLKRGQ